MQYPNQNPNQGYYPPPPDPASGTAIAALICGILGIIGGFIPIVQYFTLVLAIVGTVLGVKARKSAGPNSRGIATAGLVLGIIGLAFSAIGVICAVCLMIGLGSAIAGLGY
ncbi:hypothetical protein FACS1894105_00600 [Clostridia bacterium]|nr:hypothetical protein FACS1894105_00600 [Clostridia bacterium]